VAEPLIVCPSHGRAGRLHVLKVLPDIPLCVAESQVDDYRRAHPDQELIVHPDSVVGIAPKRQWLVDKFGDVMMFDDDLTAIVDLTVAAGEGDGKIRNPDVIRDLVYRLFDMGEALGAFVVGFSSYTVPAMFRPQNPYSFKQMVSGHCLGIRRDERIRLPNMPKMLTDDLFVSALSMHHHRMTLTELRYGAAVADTWGATGGMATHRTWQTMVENEQLMVDHFGDAIRRRQDSAMSKVRNELQLQLSVPW
jgi:hypothetical protein